MQCLPHIITAAIMCQQNTCDEVREKDATMWYIINFVNKLSKKKNMDPVWVLRA